MRAQWFSWFLTGSAKSTWQRTLNREDKDSWTSIVQAYKNHYGVHMDPRTTYLRCHELQYQDFMSAQGLLEALKDYQRMAPDQLSNNNLISILWNKVPVTLQKEVGEYKDWSLQELLQRLLRAEARIEERERRSKGNDWSKMRRSGGYKGVSKKDTIEKPVDKPPTSSRTTTGNSQREQPGTRGQDSGEMSLKNMKCFKCNKKGHLAKTCPSNGTLGSSSRVITTASDDPDEELWSRVLTSKDVSRPPRTSVTGPTYKVDIVVEGFKTRALLDNGSQVSLVRAGMLPKIEQRNNWGSDKLSSRTCSVESQPKGAGGEELGATGIVILDILLEETGKILTVPCFVLESSKPIWQGAVRNCGVILGTNATVEYGVQVVHANGTVVRPADRSSTVSCKEVLCVTLSQVVHLAPQQTKVVRATVEGQTVADSHRSLE